MTLYKALTPIALAIAVGLAAPVTDARASTTVTQSVSTVQQPLAQSLNALASQFDQVLSFKPQLVAGKAAEKLSGSYTFEQALERLLTPHGLAFGKAGSGYFIVDTQEVAELPDIKVAAVEYIVIHGQKINRSLSETIASVDIINDAQMHGGKYFSLSDILNEAVNLTPIPGGMPTVRGVDSNGSVGGFSTFTSGSKPRMSAQVDGIDQPRGPSWPGEIGLWDIDQVEIYRGPQSTLTGRNSIAGLVFVKTADPTFDWQGKARAGYRSNDGFMELAGVVSGPIVEDQLAFRLSAQVIDGETATNYTEKNYPFNPNKVENKNIRGKLLVQPAAWEQFSALFSVNRSDEQGSLNFLYDGPDLSLRQKALATDQNNKTTTYSTTLNYAFNTQFSAKAIISTQDYHFDFQNSPEDYAVKIDEGSDTFDGQLVYSANDGLLSHGLLGIYYYQREQDFQSWDKGKTFYIGDDKTESRAIYAETTFALADTLQLTAGGRYLNEKQLRNFALQRWKVDYQIDKDDSLFLPQLAVHWQINQDSSLGLSAKRGYNPGGGDFNRYTQKHYFFEPEKVNAFELTTRTKVLDKVNLVGHLFYNDYKGYQHKAIGASGHWRDYIVFNLDKVKTYGAELSLDTALGDHWQWQINLGLLDSEVTQNDKQNKAINGKQLSYAAKMTASTRLTYWMDEDSYLQWQSNYVGEHYSELENTDKQKLDGYFLSSINAGYAYKGWLFNAYVNNLFDKESATNVFYNFRNPELIRRGDLTAPRTFGVSATYHFE